MAYRLSSGLGGPQEPYPRVQFGGAKTLSASQHQPGPNDIIELLGSITAREQKGNVPCQIRTGDLRISAAMSSHN
jgi:hypothetical protein